MMYNATEDDEKVKATRWIFLWNMLFSITSGILSVLVFLPLRSNKIFSLNNSRIDVCAVFNLDPATQPVGNFASCKNMSFVDIGLSKMYDFTIWGYCDVPLQDHEKSNCTMTYGYDFNLKSFYLHESSILEQYPYLTEDDMADILWTMEPKEVRDTANGLRRRFISKLVIYAIIFSLQLFGFVHPYSKKYNIVAMSLSGILCIASLVISLLILIYWLLNLSHGLNWMDRGITTSGGFDVWFYNFAEPFLAFFFCFITAVHAFCQL